MITNFNPLLKSLSYEGPNYEILHIWATYLANDFRELKDIIHWLILRISYEDDSEEDSICICDISLLKRPSNFDLLMFLLYEKAGRGNIGYMKTAIPTLIRRIKNND